MRARQLPLRPVSGRTWSTAPETRLPDSPASPRRYAACLFLLVVLLGAGCQTYSRQAQDMNRAWSVGDAEGAARDFGRRADKKANSKDAVVWHLEAGAAFRASGVYPESNRHLDAAAARMDEYDRKAKVRLGNEAAAIFSNQQNLPYEGRPYERVMLHTYKALNFLALEEIERARPELIRAYQAQEDAVAQNQRRIEEAREAERTSGQAQAIDRTRADPALQSAIGEITRPLEGFTAYADYVNPFTVYLDGLYFLHAGIGGSDVERAIKSLRRVAEVAEPGTGIAADLAAAEAAAARSTASSGLTYVIFETGRAPSREQVRIDIPIILADVSYVGAAFPKLVFHEDRVPWISVRTANGETRTARVADMDAVVALDFKNEFPAILTKTLISTVAKAAAGWAVNDLARQQDEGLGLLARLVTAGVQAAVNIADTRCWSTLPKEFQALRLDTPPDRMLTLEGPAGSQTVHLIDGGVVVVYVKAVSAARPPLVSQFRLR